MYLLQFLESRHQKWNSICTVRCVSDSFALIKQHMRQSPCPLYFRTYVLGYERGHPVHVKRFNPLIRNLQNAKMMAKWIRANVLAEGFIYNTRIRFLQYSELDRSVLVEMELTREWFNNRQEIDIKRYGQITPE